jgi:enoyl-CoA hydratase/carnithine racemase
MSFYQNQFKDLEVTKENYLLWITLDNESMANAITDDMIDSLEDLLSFADEDNSVRTIILTGKGKCFCAGGDVKAMESKTGMFAGESDELRRRYRRGIQRIPKTIEAINTPIIAMINGAAIGAGCDLAAMCDLRIASEKAKFGETFSKLGLVPGDGGTFFLSRVLGYAKAMEMYLTGKIYNADEALSMGLVNKVVKVDELKQSTEEMALMIANNAPIAVTMTKSALKMARTADLSSQLELLASYQGIAQRTNDHFEGISALKEKRDGEFLNK